MSQGHSYLWVSLMLLVGFRLPAQVSHCLTVDQEPAVIQHLIQDATLIGSSSAATATATRAGKAIPLVFHVLHRTGEALITEEKIDEQIELLNAAFSARDRHLANLPIVFEPLVARPAAPISFCLARRQTTAGWQSAIIRTEITDPAFDATQDYWKPESGGSRPWAQDSFLNIWLITLNSSVTGFATYPDTVLTNHDGIVMHPRYLGFNDSAYGYGKVLVHEVGHYLGLAHIWGNCGSAGDGIADTPEQASNYAGCPSEPQFSCGSRDLVHNYMDYVDDDCMSMFTAGQYEQMKQVLEVLRPTLNRSLDCAKTPGKSPTNYLRCYPNPAHSVLHVEKINIEQHPFATIYAVDGRLFAKCPLVIGSEGSAIVAVDALPPGLYVVRIGQSVAKFIKSSGN